MFNFLRRKKSTIEIRYNGKLISRSEHGKIVMDEKKTVLTIPHFGNIFSHTLLDDDLLDNSLWGDDDTEGDGVNTKNAKPTPLKPTPKRRNAKAPLSSPKKNDPTLEPYLIDDNEPPVTTIKALKKFAPTFKEAGENLRKTALGIKKISKPKKKS